MRYMGSKFRLSKHLLPIILENRECNQWYVEPFAGAFNMMANNIGEPRLGNDKHYYIVQLILAIQKGWVPPDKITEKQYKHIKENRSKYNPWLVGFVGFGCSWGGIWFQSYAKGNNQNYARESRDNLLKQAPFLKNVLISNMDYRKLPIPSNSLIYCDPPYINTSGYGKKVFNHKNFWNWCRKMSNNHRVFISESEAPKDFECIWEKETKNKISTVKNQKPRIERLFIPK